MAKPNATNEKPRSSARKKTGKPSLEPGADYLTSRVAIWPVERLKPYERNARTHSADQIERIMASMREFGFTAPVLADGAGRIIAGHGRIAAAKKLGIVEVPVVVLDHLTDAQRRALIIADNKLAELAGWDLDMLSAELLDLQAEDYDLSLMGFTDEELADLLPNEQAPLPPKNPDVVQMEKITFIVHPDQAQQIHAALEVAKDMGPFVSTGNDDRDGNAIARICETFMTREGQQ